MSSAEARHEKFKKQYYSLPNREDALNAYKTVFVVLHWGIAFAAFAAAASYISVPYVIVQAAVIIAVIGIFYSALSLQFREDQKKSSAPSPTGTLADLRDKLDGDDSLESILRSTVLSSGDVTVGQRDLLLSEMDFREGQEQDAAILLKYEALSDKQSRLSRKLN